MSPLHNKKICLISSSHIGSNPRLVKEANALHEAGARVTVIAFDVTSQASVQRRDMAVLAQVEWRCVRVAARGKFQRLINGIKKRVGRILWGLGIRTSWITNLAYNPLIENLAKAGLAVEPADLYIAHNLAALPAAGKCVEINGGRLGFDAEDFHSGEFPESSRGSIFFELTRLLELSWLPRCAYVTAASPGIARAYAELTGIKEPQAILNVFPLDEAPSVATAKGNVEPGPSLYWFSQTIGPGRGLDVLIEALGLTNTRPFLYLQGTVAAEFSSALDAWALQANVADRLHILPPVLPGELVRLAARYDIGLASEMSGVEPNRDIALSNKIFTFVLAGIAVLASDTRAQTELSTTMEQDLIEIYPQGDALALAQKIDGLLSAPDRLRELRQRSWRAGQERYNWDNEKALLLEIVRRCLEQPCSAAPRSSS